MGLFAYYPTETHIGGILPILEIAMDYTEDDIEDMYKKADEDYFRDNLIVPDPVPVNMAAFKTKSSWSDFASLIWRR